MLAVSDGSTGLCRRGGAVKCGHRTGRGDSRGLPTDTSCGSGLEHVLDLLAGLLQVRAALVGLAFGFQLLVVGGLADAFLGLAAELLSLVADLVIRTPSGTSRLIS